MAINGDDRVANGLQGDFGSLFFTGQRLQGQIKCAQRINAQNYQHQSAQQQTEQTHQRRFKQQGPDVAHDFEVTDDLVALHQVRSARERPGVSGIQCF